MAGGKTNLEENGRLDALYGSGTPTNWEIALHSGDPGDDATANELVVGTSPGYARKVVTNNVTNFPAASGGIKTLNTEQQFAAATGAWLEIIAWSLKEGGTNNARHWGYLIDAPKNCMCLSADVTNNTVQSPDHGFTANQVVRVFELEGLGSVPTGLTVATQKYFVVSPTTDTFQLSLTSGGAAVDITGKGIFQVAVSRSIALPQDGVFRFLAGQLTIQES